MNKREFILSGSGGQGLILAGIILAESSLKDGKKAIQMQSFGPEARGGASKAEVLISDEEINYPKVTEADVLLCLTQKSLEKYESSLKEGGILIIDQDISIDGDLEEKLKSKKVIQIPIIQTAIDTGRVMVANIVALGAIRKATEIVSEEALQEAILSRVPKGTEDMNLKAFQAGQNLVEKEKVVLYGEVS